MFPDLRSSSSAHQIECWQPSRLSSPFDAGKVYASDSAYSIDSDESLRMLRPQLNLLPPKPSRQPPPPPSSSTTPNRDILHSHKHKHPVHAPANNYLPQSAASTRPKQLDSQPHSKEGHRRTYSEQDQRTRNARASLPARSKPVELDNRRSAISYPIYSSSLQSHQYPSLSSERDIEHSLRKQLDAENDSTLCDSTGEQKRRRLSLLIGKGRHTQTEVRIENGLRIYNLGGRQSYSQTQLYRGADNSYQYIPRPTNMEPVRSPRSISSNVSKTTFVSRAKSPLSISSSIDYQSSRTSEDSSVNSYNGKPDLLPMRYSPPKALSTWPQGEMNTPLRYGAGGNGRQQIQTTLMTPQRMRITPGPTSPTKAARHYPKAPGEGFRKLPEEILLVILAELKKSHLKAGSLSCSTCWMRELLSLGLSCRKWWSAASCMLYQDIQLIGSDSVLHTKKKYKMKHGTRLKLLRRTLRSRPDLAHHVKSLKVPSMPEGAKTKVEQDDYVDLVASVIMACPNLERLPGFYPTYNHEFSRFAHALSTRQKLLERVWIIDPSLRKRQGRFNISETDFQVSVSAAPLHLLPEQSIDFLNYHSNWPHLQTLFLHCNPGGLIDSLLFEDVFRSLPRLENLHVSNFPESSFNDSTLLALPPLRSLRLENLPGITADGLSSFASPRRTDTLKSLSLISLPLISLPVLARMFSHLKSLTHFTISQGPSLRLPVGEVIFLHPYLASSTLEHIHWEFTSPDDEVGTEILAKAIAFGGFPSLKSIRAPTDYDGSLQMYCKPRDRIELPGDRYRNLGVAGLPLPYGMPNQSSPTRSTFGGPNMPSPTRSTFSLGHNSSGSVASMMKSPSRSTFSAPDQKSHPEEQSKYKCTSLSTSRRMAQHRIEAATTQPQFQILIWDPSGVPTDRYDVGGFIGKIESKVFYSLRPDVDGMDESLVSVEGLLDGVGGLGEEVNVRDGCTGSWILDTKVGQSRKGQKRGKESWWHTERGRWKELSLERFF